MADSNDQGPSTSGQVEPREPRREFAAEAPLEALVEPVTPTRAFFERHHFGVPHLDPEEFNLVVEGAFERPLELSLEDLRAMGGVLSTVYLESASNANAELRPAPLGVLWGHGGVSQAEFLGVPLRAVLERAGLKPDAVEIVFSGADSGEVAAGRTESFARSLPVAVALDPSVLLAWGMNGKPLTAAHGAPLRLVVPGWYGFASVKWLTRVTAVKEPFEGHFQSERYVYRGEEEETPVTRVRVRSLFVSPRDGGEHAFGVPIEVHGVAWSGAGRILRVEVREGQGEWHEAELAQPPSPNAMARWRFLWHPSNPGDFVLQARATDEGGDVQPHDPAWNELGYGNNAVQHVRVHVRDLEAG